MADKPDLQSLVKECIEKAAKGDGVIATITPCKFCGAKAFKVTQDIVAPYDVAIHHLHRQTDYVNGEAYICSSCGKATILVHAL